VVELVPLEPWHVEVMHANGDIDPIIYNSDYDHYLAIGTGHVLIVDGVIRGAAGIIPLWGKVADAWAIITPWCREHPVTLLKAFKAKFIETCTGYDRVQITVEEGFDTAEKFAQFLGFTFEGKMEYYAPNGKTHLRYARINHG